MLEELRVDVVTNPTSTAQLRAGGMSADGTEPGACKCGLDEPTNFPRRPVRGDRCPIGGLQLHHWHGTVCVFCGGTVILDTAGGRHYVIDNGEPVCCREPMVHNTGGWYECADAYFYLSSDDEEHPEDRVLGDIDLIVEREALTDYQRERYDHWRAMRVMDEAVWPDAR